MEAGEASEYLRVYARGVPQVDENGEPDPYTEAQAQDAVAQAYTREPRDPPGLVEPQIDLKDRINADPIQALNSSDVLIELARMKKRNPIQYDAFVKEITTTHKKTGIRADTVRSQVDSIVLPKDEEPETEDTPEDLEKIAMRIAERGKPLKFMLGTFNETHRGDQLHAEFQFIEFGLQSATNTNGVFGTWDGPSGKGKSSGAKACVKQLPPEYVIIASITSKSLYYRSLTIGILPGSVIYLDDRKVVEGSDLEETLRRMQTFFQEGAEHETLDGKGEYHRHPTPAAFVGNSNLCGFVRSGRATQKPHHWVRRGFFQGD
jgi:hypothetical protein